MKPDAEAALIEARNMARKSKAHANSARAIYNKNKGKMDAVDAAQTLAQVSIAETLAAAFDLVITAIEEES